MGSDLVEVIGIVRPEMAGEATSLLLANGIQGEVRMSEMGRGGTMERCDVLVHPRDVERALEMLAVNGFPAGGLPEDVVEDEAAKAVAADASVTDFLHRGR
jgi:type III secretory pathway lipoprotein EscJ